VVISHKPSSRPRRSRLNTRTEPAPSWPGLSRPSTVGGRERHSARWHRRDGVDTRDKPGHDERGWGRYHAPPRSRHPGQGEAAQPGSRPGGVHLLHTIPDTAGGRSGMTMGGVATEPSGARPTPLTPSSPGLTRGSRLPAARLPQGWVPGSSPGMREGLGGSGSGPGLANGEAASTCGPNPRRHGRACPGHPRLAAGSDIRRGGTGGTAWIPGTSPGMTNMARPPRVPKKPSSRPRRSRRAGIARRIERPYFTRSRIRPLAVPG